MFQRFVVSGTLILWAAGLAVAAAPSGIDGKWQGTIAGFTLSYTFKADGNKLTGTADGPDGEQPITDGKIEGDQLSFKTKYQGDPVDHHGTLSGDTIQLKVSGTFGEGEMTLERVAEKKAESSPILPPVSAQTNGAFTGPYPVVMDAVPGLPDYTIFRPADLAKVGGKLPVVAYGNGGCFSIGNYSENFLGEVASYGFVVTVPGPVMRDGVKQTLPPGGLPARDVPPSLPGQGGGTPGRGGEQADGAPGAEGHAAPRPPAGGTMPPQSKPDQMIAVFNWVGEENARPDSPFHGRLDADRMGVMGGSCGGLQAISVAGDPRVKTLVALDSGVIRGGLPPGMPHMVLPATEADLKKVHSPTLYVIGGPMDIAYPNAEKDFAMIDGVPLFNANIDKGHAGTWMEPLGGAMGKVAVAWLRWQLQGDDASATMFRGAECGLCTDKLWTVKKKNMN